MTDACASHGLSLRSYGASRGSHAHDHFQVLIGLDGMLELEIEGRGQRIAAGGGYVVAPGDRHDFEATGGSRCLVLDTGLAAWTACSNTPPALPHALMLARYLAQCLSQAQHHALALQHGPQLLREAWALPSPEAPRARRRIDWSALTAWAEANWHQPIGVAELAAVACLSASQFAQRCREEQQMSVMQWLRIRRLAHARALRRGGLPVAEAARRTGYRSPSALTAAMRRLDGHH